VHHVGIFSMVKETIIREPQSVLS